MSSSQVIYGVELTAQILHRVTQLEQQLIGIQNQCFELDSLSKKFEEQLAQVCTKLSAEFSTIKSNFQVISRLPEIQLINTKNESKNNGSSEK